MFASNRAEKAANYLIMLAAFETGCEPTTPDGARRAGMAEAISYHIDTAEFDLCEVLKLSEAVGLHAAGVAGKTGAGCLAFDLAALGEVCGSRKLARLALLCAEVFPRQIGGKSIWTNCAEGNPEADVTFAGLAWDTFELVPAA